PPLDGQSLVGLLEDKMTKRERPLGFWDAGIAGFGTPSDRILSYVGQQQSAGEPIPEDHAAHGLRPASLDYWKEPAGSFPGHAAWLDEGWKLHRIQDKKSGRVRWELYNLNEDDKETTDLSQKEADRTARM